MSERVFVSGEDGLLPRALIAALRQRGDVILNDGMDKRWSPPPEILQAVGAMGPRENEVDVLHHRIVELVVAQKPTLIVHAAALTGTDKCVLDESLAWQCNVESSFNMALAAKRSGARLLHFGSSASYDPAARPPFERGTPIKPYTIYGQTKYIGEVTSRLIYGDDGLLIIRPNFIYGGVRDTSSTITRIAKAVIFDAKPVHVLLDKKYKKDFMHVDDLAPVIIGMLNRGASGLFNISRGSPRYFGDAVGILGELLGRWAVGDKMDYHPEGDYMRDHFSDGSEASAWAQYWPHITLEEGLAKVVTELKELREVSRGGPF